MKLQRQIDYLQTQRASEWYEALKRKRPEDMSAFLAWCKKSPAHIEAFLKITWTDQMLDGLDRERSIDLDGLLAQISGNVRPLAPPPVAQTRQRRSSATRGRDRWLRPMAAAVVAVAVGLAGYVYVLRLPQEFSTKIGELRTVELKDTSIVTLNTDSDIQVQFQRDARDIELRHGEAVFKVAHDPARPFRVRTAVGTVQAVGTQFNVYARADGTDVAVLEGRVRLMPRADRGREDMQPEELAAGEQARIGVDGRIYRAQRADVERAAAWSKRQLKFDETALEDMVYELNRYHRDLRLRLEGIAPGSYHYSGIFDADKPETLAEFLANEPDLIVERRGSEIVIRAR